VRTLGPNSLYLATTVERPLLVRALLPLAAALISLLFASSALAQNKQIEQQARQLQKKAMEEDYLTTEFAKAQDKLTQAIQKCGTNQCPNLLRAQLKRDLGVVQIGGQINKDEGVKNFTEAQQIDAAVQLDPDLKTKEIEDAWEKAKKAAGAGGGGGGGGGGTGPAPSGDFTHTPVAMQLARTPVPIYAEYGGSEAIVRVIARYKAFGMTEWKSIELKRMDKGWGAVVPCIDVIQGDLQYYLQGFNDQNDPVATAGDRNHPYKVPIKRDKIEGEAPHLPGQAPPAQCPETGDCPPDFPGCHGGTTATKGKGEGEECEEDAACESKQCKQGKCTAPEAGKPKFRRLWLGLTAGAEFMLVGSGDNVCKLSQDKNAAPINDAGYYCADPNNGNADYPDRNDPQGNQNKAIVQDGKTDKVAGGGAFGNVRILLSIDYAFNPNFMAGLRGGVIVNGYPGTAASNDGKFSALGPVHLEARATYLIGKDALLKPGVAPYIMGGVGYSQFTARVGVSVREQGTPQNKQVDAWAIGGPIFFSLGGGIRYALGAAARAALLIGPRINVALGNGLGVFPSGGIEGGIQFGL
jgi:hypothetical protein